MAGAAGRAGAAPAVRLGLRANAPQFGLLVGVNALVGAMVGLERSTLSLVGRDEFGVASTTALLTFVAAFGAAKAVTNLAAGGLADRAGRRRLLIAGWALALPVPVLVGVAGDWAVIVAANVLLGLSQGLAWSMTVVMKIDLVGPRRRGLALGLNEAAGYGGVALAAAAAGALAATIAAREVIVIGGLVVAALGLAASVLLVRDTGEHVALEQEGEAAPGGQGRPAGGGLGRALAAGTLRDRTLRACSQAGLVNNLNDGLAWGIVPLFLAAHGAGVGEIGAVAGAYPAVWGVGQLLTGAWSDRAGRRRLIVAGMAVQAAALALLAASGGRFGVALAAAIVLGAGTALVYPTLLAAVSDRVEPVGRAAALGVYRFWRDAGYVAGALAGGAIADAAGLAVAIAAVAGLTAASAAWTAWDMPAAAQ